MYHPQAGEHVKAFHPKMLGVVKTGEVKIAGRRYAHIDFGPLLGGIARVPYAYVVGPAD